MQEKSPGSEAESFKAKDPAQLAAELRGDDAGVERGSSRPETSPAKQLERGEFDYSDPDSPDFVAEGDSPALLQTVINRYFQAEPRRARLVNYRYSQLRERDQERLVEAPRATVAIPVAIHNEEAATLQQTLAEVARQEGVEQDEVLLYANMPETLSDEEKQAARAKLEAVIAAARQESPQLTIRSVVVEYEEDKLGIGRVRHDYMDLIAWDAARRGFGMDHPVIILDADTKQMSKDTFAKLSEVLTAPDSDIIMAHTETHYLFDEKEDDGEMSDARRLAVLQEIRRRQYLRQESQAKAEDLDRDIGEVYNQGHYDEEWGMAVALGPYVLVGGYDEQSKLDESRFLSQRLYDQDGAIYDIMQYAKPGIEAGELFNGMYYLVGTKVRGSGRRHEQRLREWVAGGVADARYADMVEKHVASGHQYEDFSHTDALRSARVVADEPSFKDEAQAKKIVKSVLKPDAVPRVTGEPVPMPDPEALLRRLDLPQSDD